MENANFIIQYIADIKDIKRKVKELDRINDLTAKKLGKDFSRATQVMSRSIDQVSQKRIQLKGGQQAVQTISKINTVVKTANGSLRTLTETTTRVNGALRSTNSVLKNGGKATRSFADNISTLTKRALITIPVWFALRNTIFGVFRAIRDGFQSLIDFDRILQKARRSLSGTTTEIEKNFKSLRKEVEALALETGESVTDITSAFQRFATVGFDFETSMAGATNATKLAVTLFGDAEQNANALARAFKVLQDRSEGAISPAEQLGLISAQLADLWRDNAFEINEFAGALERFAPIANIAGFSAQQTVSVLASLQTAGIRGTRAGRLLGTAVQQLDKNFGKINKTLGLNINPELTTTFERFLLVLDAVSELNEVSAFQANKALEELFGGVRSKQTAQALIALKDVLDENLKRIGDVEEFDKAFKEVSDTLSRQVDRFVEVKDASQRAFVAGLLGGENLKDTLKEVNSLIGANVNEFNKLGQAIVDISIFGLTGPIGIIVKSERDSIKAFAKARTEFLDKVNEGLQGRLDETELTKLIDDLDKRFNSFLRTGIPIPFTDRTITALRKELDKFEESSDSEVKIKPVIDDAEVAIGLERTNKVSEIIIKNELDRLRVSGALNSQILITEQLLKKQFGLEDDILETITKELQIEREIANERRLQNQLSSETIKLFKIAQTEGTDVAKRIGDVLAGDVDFDNFIRRGGQAVEVFKKQFAGIFEQQQALRFFRGDVVPGLDLRGGAGINIREEEIRGRGDARSRAILERNVAIARVAKSLEVQDQTVDRMVVKSIFFPSGPLTGPNLISNADLQSRISQPGVLTNTNLNRFIPTQSRESLIRIEFNGKEVVSLLGSPEDVAKQIQDTVGKAVTDEIIKQVEDTESKLGRSLDNR